MEISFRESYVLRIYRRDDKDPERIRGIVEMIATNEQKAFGSMSELRDILVSAGTKKLREKQAP